jgi:uncharacterized protein
MSEGTNFFTVLAKPTGRCNLKCTFCYQDFNEMYRGGRMGPEVMETLVKRACEHPCANVSLQWIGGESLAVGPDFYRECEDLIQRYAPEDKYISCSIQTNGTLIDERWTEFLLTHPRYKLSISFEILPSLQNRLRPGRGRFVETYPWVSKGLQQLRAAGISFGVLTVIERETLDIEPAEWLQAVVDHGIHQIGLQLSYRNVYTGDLALVERYLDWLDELFECQAAYNMQCADPRDILIIRESLYLFNLIRRPKVQLGSCHHLRAVCTDFLVSVDDKGRVFGHCDSFMGSQRADGSHYEIGNIMESSFAEMIAGEAARSIKKQLIAGRLKCQSCSYFGLCRGGCGFFKAMQGGEISAGQGDSIESYCALTIGMLQHVTTAEKRKPILDSYRPLISQASQDFHFVKDKGCGNACKSAMACA